MKTFEITAKVEVWCKISVEAKTEKKAKDEARGILENGNNYGPDGLVSYIDVQDVEIEDCNEE